LETPMERLAVKIGQTPTMEAAQSSVLSSQLYNEYYHGFSIEFP